MKFFFMGKNKISLPKFWQTSEKYVVICISSKYLSRYNSKYMSKNLISGWLSWAGQRKMFSQWTYSTK